MLQVLQPRDFVPEPTVWKPQQATERTVVIPRSENRDKCNTHTTSGNVTAMKVVDLEYCNMPLNFESAIEAYIKALEAA